MKNTLSLNPFTDALFVTTKRWSYMFVRAFWQPNSISLPMKCLVVKTLISCFNKSFSSLVLLVKKKDESWRFCIDYKALKEATIKDRFPIPTIDDMLYLLSSSKFFTKLDLRAIYHQIRIHEEDIYKMTFHTYSGHFEYLVMPFSTPPSTFQSCINQIVKPFLRKFVIVFFEDIIVYTKEWKEHLEHLKTVMQLLMENSLFINPPKCSFG